MIRHLLIIIALLAAGPALGQTVIQSGTITPGHTASWVSSGVVRDGGSATNGYLTSVGIFANGGLPDCITASTVARQTFNPASSPYTQLCFYVNVGSDADITLNSYNGAANATLNFRINGVTYTFPYPPNAPVGRQISTGTTDTAGSGDITIAWNSSSAGVKTENLYACNTSTAWFKLIIKDEIGTAAVYAIKIIPNGSDTIDHASNLVLGFNTQSSTIQCDGSGNWMQE